VKNTDFERYYGIFKAVTAGAAVLVGAVMLTIPGRAGPLTPWIVMGVIALVMAADFLEARADRKADREDGDQR
jgi:hypothetical protein